MLRKALSLAFTLLLTAAHAPAQTNTAGAARQQQPAAQKPAPPAEESEEVVRITSKLVQLDVVVTDKEGRQVTDLKAEDFEILEDGRSQQITNFSYVSTGPSPSPAPSKGAEARAGATPSAPPPSAPRRVKLKKQNRARR